LQKASITLWDKNNERLNKIRAKLLIKNQNVKRSTLINMLMEIAFDDHPGFLDNPEEAINLHKELKK